MSLEIFFINCILAILLLVINTLIGRWKQVAIISFNYSSFGFDDISDKKFSENFFHLIVHPAIFLAIACSILQSFSLGSIALELWLVVPLYWVLRFFIALVRNIIPLVNLRLELVLLIISIGVSEATLFFIIHPLIGSGKTVFIDLAQFRDAFWFAAFTYLATLIWGITKRITKGNKLYPVAKKEKTIIRRYQKFFKRYSDHIASILKEKYSFPNNNSKQHFTCLLYSIMIFEDHNRSRIIRGLEYCQKLFHRNQTYTLGIMQIKTQTFISNKKSIELAIQKMYPVFTASDCHIKLYNSIIDYNNSTEYYKQVLAIYEVLRKHLNLCELGTQKVSVSKLKRILCK